MTDKDSQQRRDVVVITGGRDRTPTLAEMERFEQLRDDLGVRVVRHGGCPPRTNEAGQLVGSTDTLVAAYLRSRWPGTVEEWKADWQRFGRSAGPRRNREMVSGKHHERLVPEPPANAVIAFAGGSGTLDCCVAGYEASLVVHHVWPVDEPRIWNSHHGKPPGPSLYCGRQSPVGNPDALEQGLGEARAQAADLALAKYKAWLWRRINKKSREYDQRVVDYIMQLTPRHYAVCSCWPAHCHASILIEAWRWLQGNR